MLSSNACCRNVNTSRPIGNIYALMKEAIIGSDNGLSPAQCQAIIWTSASVLVIIEHLGTNFTEIWMIMILKKSLAKWWPFSRPFMRCRADSVFSVMVYIVVKIPRPRQPFHASGAKICWNFPRVVHALAVPHVHVNVTVSTLITQRFITPAVIYATRKRLPPIETDGVKVKSQRGGH